MSPSPSPARSVAVVVVLIATAALLFLSPALAASNEQAPSLHRLRAALADLTRPALCITRRAHAIASANAVLQAAVLCTGKQPPCDPQPDVAALRTALSVAKAVSCATQAPEHRIDSALRAFETAANSQARALGLAPAYDTLVLEPFGDAPYVASLSLHSVNGTAVAQARSAAMAMQTGALPSRTRVYVPQAPKRAVLVFGSQNLTAWFDVLSKRPEGPWASGQIDAAVRAVDAILAADARLFGSDRWMAGATGFSQGGALAVALSLSKRVSGVSVLSGFVPDPLSYPRAGTVLSEDSRALVVHGDADVIAPVVLARLSVQVLRGLGRNVTYEELPDVGHTLGDRLGESYDRAYDWIGHAMVPGRRERLVAPAPLVWTLRARDG